MNNDDIPISKSQKISILLTSLESAFTDVLPDDDTFWENHREDVMEIYGYIHELRKINVTE